MIYVLIKRQIETGSFDRDDLRTKIDVFYFANRLSAAEYEELTALLAA